MAAVFSRLARSFGVFWLNSFYWWTRHAPWGPRLTAPLWVNLSWRLSPYLRKVTRNNASHILGVPAVSDAAGRLGYAMHRDFYDFTCDLGASCRQTPAQMLARIEGVEGAEDYHRARAMRKGAVLVTAHFGNYEVGLAEVRRLEERVHVVFQRDAAGAFEATRARLRRTLGVIETPIDDGLTSWLALRDALAADAVVMLQGDRTMPGQRGQRVPFFDGEIELPIGPAKLALMTGAPLVPVFAVRVPGRGRRVRIEIDPPIVVEDPAAVPEAVEAVGRSIERRVRAHPEQWHVLYDAFAG